MIKTRLSEIKALANRNLCTVRTIHRMVFDVKFDKAWQVTSDEQREEVKKYINNCDIDKLENWILITLRENLEEMSLRRLREIGQMYGIPYYNRITKASLLKRIQKAIYNVKKTREVDEDPDLNSLAAVRIRPEEKGHSPQSRSG